MRPLRVALTGGIASGKSSVCSYFEKLGIPVIDADRITHELVQPGMPALKQITELFGEDIIDSDDQLDRSLLRSLVFNNPDLRKKLEDVLHPLVYKKIETRYKTINSTYCIISIPLLIETDASSRFDRILVIDIPLELQIQRIVNRDAVSKQDAIKIIEAQAGREERNAVADDIIINDKDLGHLEARINQLHTLYTEIAENIRNQA